MNHCRDCNSDYATPGTCNCFAPGGKRSASPWVERYPWYPSPWYPWPYYPSQPTWTISGNHLSGNSGNTITLGNFQAE